MASTIAYLKARWGEATSHIGILLGAVAAGATAAAVLSSPWSYLAFVSAAGLYAYPQGKRNGD